VIRDRPRRSGTFLALALVTAIAGGAVAATLVTSDEAPAALQPASTLTEAAAQPQGFDDRRSVEVTLTVSEETPLTVNASGAVTALHTTAGGTITSGSSPLEVAGLPLLALHLIRRQESYGYELVERLSALGLDVSTGLVYPVLNRLERDALVTTSSRPSPSGPPRKYFSLTDAGETALATALSQWEQTAAVVSAALDPERE